MRNTPLPAHLQLALDACHACVPLLTGEICFWSIGEEFKAKGVTYHHLAMLARRGYLQRTGEMRSAVFYRIVPPSLTNTRRNRRGR
jgi:hypothetical protein